MKGKFLKATLLVLGLVFSSLIYSTPPDVLAKEPTGEEFRVGVIGTFSGSSAAWGLTMKYSTQAVAEGINKEGGLLVGGKRHPIKIFAEDDKFDTKLARAAAEKLIYRDNVKYITGPVTSPTCSGAQVVCEPAKTFMVAYGYTKALYTPEHPYTIFGMVAPFQSAPILYKYLIDTYKVKSVSLVAKNYAGALSTRDWCIEAANKLGLKIISAKETYEPEATDFFPIMGSVVKGTPT